MPPKISSAEWEVMSVLWEQSPLAATEVFAGLPGDHGWKPKTVNTFLARLADKGALKVVKRDGVNVFAPRVRREDCIASESDDFLQRVFRGAAGPLLLHFCQQEKLSEAEIAELQKLLRQKKGQP
ncbi:BlaI/MecI/CopY family transcriptional regulator [Oleiharenicola lentus]|uniref:BlaI/MecI/CopY family transcriptional regulator n=1 Tax=Oleiharenicola lentus TaxID=2508720 RepID=UPI003F661794